MQNCLQKEKKKVSEIEKSFNILKDTMIKDMVAICNTQSIAGKKIYLENS